MKQSSFLIAAALGLLASCHGPEQQGNSVAKQADGAALIESLKAPGSDVKSYGEIGNELGQTNICLKIDTVNDEHYLLIVSRDTVKSEFKVIESIDIVNNPVVLFVGPTDGALYVIKKPDLSQVKFMNRVEMPISNSTPTTPRLTIQKRLKGIPRPGDVDSHIIVGLDDPSLFAPNNRNLTESDCGMKVNMLVGSALKPFTILAYNSQTKSIVLATEYGAESWMTNDEEIGKIMDCSNKFRIYWGHQ